MHGSIMTKLFKFPGKIFAGLWVFSFTAFAHSPEALPAVAVSSVLIQPELGFVHFPGIPAVLRTTSPTSGRRFVIEQYYRQSVDASKLRLNFRGPWPVEEKGTFNRFVRIVGSQCEDQPVYIRGLETEYPSGLYRCVSEFHVKSEIPTGIIGVEVSHIEKVGERSIPNAVFRIIIPESEKLSSSLPTRRYNADYVRSDDPLEVDFADDLPPFAKNIVQISASGVVTHGSGFLTNSTQLIPRMFKSIGQPWDTSNLGQIFVVTASHLFPISYRTIDMYKLVRSILPEIFIQTEKKDFAYDLRINGHLIRNVAALFGRNIESDFALLSLDPSRSQEIAEALDLKDLSEFQGLQLAPKVTEHTQYKVFGYPVTSNGSRLPIFRQAFLAKEGYPTDETTNFGSILKMNLESATEGRSVPVAEPGMSGGPILNSNNEVVGIAIEKPNDIRLNRIVALDLTTFDQIERGTNARDDLGCMVAFDPSDRLLVIKRNSANCRYGTFGSAKLRNSSNFHYLSGEWAIQEVLGIADPKNRNEERGSSIQPRIGFQLTNGTGIISGVFVPHGEQSNMMVWSSNISPTELNQIRFPGGYRFNPDSFADFVPVGVRIIKFPFDSYPERALVGRLIRGIKLPSSSQSPVKYEFQPVSIRDFAIWLHEHEDLKRDSEGLVIE